MTQQRNAYIAEKILDGDRIGYDNNKFLGWYIPKLNRFFPIDTDFESLPEWTGPICDVVLPMIAKKGWHMSFLFNGHVDICDSESWAILDIPPAPLSTVLIDIHIKTQENELIFS
ncbi:hypothetical protein QMM42_04960 [Leptospira santarosai]|uniref:hypothetical protein n=1 Tax=Leptospira santarosai TaxID=28183 RepID=UPI0024AEE4B6|nr:hypothetical protein [Leptospira santarosai]MDI7185568.1 hypothetical protein [Leptospira santarosai]